MTAADGTPVDALAPLIGQWKLLAGFGDTPAADIGARATFEWLPGGRFVVERWVVPIPEAPDGIAIIGADPENEGRYLQHYFDSRGVARVYRMRLADGVWELSRHEPDFSPLEFSQRFSGTFGDGGDRIDGRWEICHDGETWERDFDLAYERVREP